MTKDDVLALLEQADAPVSGEQMCKTLGLTRAAVWKAIEALRADGYEIEAATRRGYFLCTCPLTKSALERRLAGQFPTEKLIVLPEVDSTNNYLKTLAANGAPDGTAVLSLKQTAGPGRRGRSFLSEPGGLYLSFLMRPQEPAEALLHLTALAGLCVCTAVKQVTGMQAGIKWPNDPVLNGKKLCGILTELSVSLETQEPEYVVIGIGVNCNNASEDFPPELREVATSLYLETGKRVQRAALAAALIEELDKLYAALQSGDTASYLTAYRRDCLTLGREVQLLWQNVKEKVTALDVDDQFGLVVRRTDGTVETIRTGEVSVRGLYGYVE